MIYYDILYTDRKKNYLKKIIGYASKKKAIHRSGTKEKKKMEKIRITEKEIKENYKNIYYCNYCNLQNLLTYYQPDYYTKGVYGWNADIYILDFDTVIVTGYRPFGNIKIENTEELEKEAKKVLCSDLIENDKNYIINKIITENFGGAE